MVPLVESGGYLEEVTSPNGPQVRLIRVRSLEIPTPFAGANRSRFEGLRLPALSALMALPCRTGQILQPLSDQHTMRANRARSIRSRVGAELLDADGNGRPVVGSARNPGTGLAAQRVREQVAGEWRRDHPEHLGQ